MLRVCLVLIGETVACCVTSVSTHRVLEGLVPVDEPAGNEDELESLPRTALFEHAVCAKLGGAPALWRVCARTGRAASVR